MRSFKRAKKHHRKHRALPMDPARKFRAIGPVGGLVRLKKSSDFTPAGIYIRGPEVPGLGVMLTGLESFGTTVLERDYGELELLNELPPGEDIITLQEFEGYYWSHMASLGIERPPEDGGITMAITALDKDGNPHTEMHSIAETEELGSFTIGEPGDEAISQWHEQLRQEYSGQVH